MNQPAWRSETREMPADPVSGARIYFIAKGGNLYCESPMTSPDGQRFVFANSENNAACYQVFDFGTMSFAKIDADCSIANSAYSPNVYCWHPAKTADQPMRIYRINLQTLERTLLAESWNAPARPNGFMDMVSPDGRYLFYIVLVPPTSRIIRVDLRDGSWQAIAEESSDLLSHMQVEPITGDELLVQINRGFQCDEKGAMVRLCGPLGATHVIMASDGTHRRALPVGEPITSFCSGHSAWIAGTRRVAVALDWVHNPPDRFDPKKPADWTIDARFPGATLVTVAAGDERAVPFIAPEHRFFHVSVSRCGRYFVCDSTPGRMSTTDIVVGNFATGKYRTLISRIHDYAAPPYGMVPNSQPYFTADLKHIIFKSKPTVSSDWNFDVCAARLPDGFLESLD